MLSIDGTFDKGGRMVKRVGKEGSIYLHAEIAALVKAREPVYKMEILRFNAAGKPVLAKPCEGCALAMKEFGVKVIVHT